MNFSSHAICLSYCKPVPAAVRSITHDIVVWDVVTNNLPELRAQIVRYLAETDWQQWNNQ